MHKNLKLTLLGAAALTLLGAQFCFAQDDLEFHGYLRSGTGLNSNFAVAGYGVNENIVGRLGNENTSWIQSELAKKITAEDGTWAKVHVEFTADGTNMGLMDNSGNYNQLSAYLSQAYVEMGDFSFDPKAVIHIGARNNFEDIHMMDFKWRNLDGAGIGVEGALNGALSVNLLTRAVLVSQASVPLTLDVRYNILPTLQVEASGAYAYNAQKITSSSTDSSYGLQGAVVYYWNTFYGIPVGWTTLAAQAGMGMFGVSLNNSSNWSALGSLGNVYTNQNSFSSRVITSGTGNFGIVDLAGALWAEYDISDQTSWSSAASANAKADPWITVAAAVRPDWKITKNFSLTGEAGVGYQTGGGYYWDNTSSTSYERTGMLYKFTVAPTLSLDSSIGVRPQLRVFATCEGQDSKLGNISEDGKQAQELSFGAQVEAWW